jgi:transcriptional regulator GlxA family with amidase domain
MTSAGVSAGIDIGLALCGELVGRELAEAIELSMQYDPQPPFGTGDPARSATPERIRLIENVLRR